jgi:hypothetical protein
MIVETVSPKVFATARRRAFISGDTLAATVAMGSAIDALARRARYRASAPMCKREKHLLICDRARLFVLRPSTWFGFGLL